MKAKYYSCYFVHLRNDDEDFFKIGFSGNVQKRYKQYESLGFVVTPIVEAKYKSRNTAVQVEANKLKYYLPYKYTPKNNFPGYTECISSEIWKDILYNEVGSAICRPSDILC